MKPARMLALLALASFVTPVFATIGCGHGSVRSIMASPDGASETERSYDLGYRMGTRDRDSNLTSSYERHRLKYGPETQKSFELGYQDGFSSRPNRYGAPEARAWQTHEGD
jgi:hypothetical protein